MPEATARLRARACSEVAAAMDTLVRALPSDSSVSKACVLVAFSGGLDSTVLLHAAVATLGAARCCAVHIHHGLSTHADTWQAHCADVAAALGCTFVAQRVQLAGEAGASVEASARDARYAALARVYREREAIALLLGQHADDQAETVLLQLLRGAGLPGLAAMASESADPYGMVRLRPWLGLTRATLAGYAQAHGLHWVEDESNLDTRFTRNALRHDLVPVLERHFPAYRGALARAARHAAQAQSVLDEMAQIDLRALALTDDAPGVAYSALSQPGLAALSQARAANVLRYWMKALGLPAAPAARLEQALQQIRGVRADAALRIDHAGRCLRVYRGQISWDAPPRERPQQREIAPAYPAAYLAPEGPQVVLQWPGSEVWHLDGWRGSYVLRPVAQRSEQAVPVAWLHAMGVSVRARSGGELMRTHPGRSRRTLKKLFQERGVPAWRREVPLLFAADTLLWVPQLGLNYDVFTAAGERGLAQGEGGWIEIEWVPDLLLA